MKRIFLVVLVGACFFPSAAGAGGFRPVAPMDSSRLDPVVVSLPGGEVLVAGGDRGPEGATRSAEIFNPQTEAWTTVGALQEARTGALGALLQDGRVLVVGGKPGRQAVWSPLASAEIFNPDNNTFQKLSAAPLARAYGATSVLPDGRVLLWGGQGTSGTEPQSQIFDPSSNTFQAAGMPRPALLGGSTDISLPDGALRAGGWQPGSATAATLVWSGGSWKRIASLRQARGDAAGIRLPDGKILVAGGWGRGQALRSTEVFDGTGWRRAQSLRTPRLGADMVLSGGRPMLLSGWIGGKSTNRTEVLYQKGWRQGPRMMSVRWGASSQALPGNSLLVLGGVGPGGFVRGTSRKAEIYDPRLSAPWVDIQGPRRSGSSPRFDFLVQRPSPKHTIEYRLDRGAWKRSGARLRLRGLRSGRHLLEARSRVYQLRSPVDRWRFVVR